MLRGEVITDGWASDEVKEALDWCLACKGCRSDCPTHTDMAAYKAEFLSHYYETHRRPRQALVDGPHRRMGAAGLEAFRGWRIVVLAASFESAWPVSASTRTLPKFAPRTLPRAVQAERRRHRASRVVLFDDTFNNHFRPADRARRRRSCSSARAARSSCRAQHVCCGRPYYDYGMLDEAKRALERVLEVAVRSSSAAPVVVLEPGCLSVFRDELRQLLPDDPRAASARAAACSRWPSSCRRERLAEDRATARC